MNATLFNNYSNSSSNYSSATTTAAASTAVNTAWLTDLDYLSRTWTFVCHLTYFIIVFTHADQLMLHSLFHMHHVNIVGFFFALLYMCWINSSQPHFASVELNNFLCSLSETVFAVLKFTRSYSILTLALFRITAVFKINLYKRISLSYRFTILSTCFSWLCGALIFIIGKFGGDTVPNPILCVDGYSTDVDDAIFYFAVTVTLGFVVPITCIVVSYVAIIRKLSKLTASLGKSGGGGTATSSRSAGSTNVAAQTYKVSPSDPAASQQREVFSVGSGGNSTLGSSTTDSSTRRLRKTDNLDNKSKEKRLSNQFLVLSLMEIGSSIALAIILIANIFPILSSEFYWLRQMARIINLIFQSMIPILTLAFHPFELRVWDRFKCLSRNQQLKK